jgi:hypothetical protein
MAVISFDASFDRQHPLAIRQEWKSGRGSWKITGRFSLHDGAPGNRRTG